MALVPLVGALAVAASSAPVLAAPPNVSQRLHASGVGAGSTPLGIDISWPQCGFGDLPTDPAFVVVGVNGGLATTTNPCLADQLAYARASATGATNQPKVQLYVNTANPGGMNTPSWPTSNVDPAANRAPNPYGRCDNSDSLACAWQYGWNRAVEDVVLRFRPAAGSAGVAIDPRAYVWWLDVETENTWKTGGTAFDHRSNVAVLEGMAEHFTSVGAKVGIYSTAVQWRAIVGAAVGPTSSLNGRVNWRSGGASLATARNACTAAPLTSRGRVVMTQFVERNLDFNYSCPLRPLTVKIAGPRVAKRAKRANFVYRITNTTGAPIRGVVVANTLPRGMFIDRNSRRANRSVRKRSLRFRGRGRRIVFRIGTIPRGRTVRLRVNVKVAARTRRGTRTTTVVVRGSRAKAAKFTRKLIIR
jgi:hypothetical protein